MTELRSLHVLLVEDSPTDAKLVVHELRKMTPAIEFERVEDAPAMREALRRKAWDLVISDWSMPQFSAPAALAVIKEMKLDLPFIIVSGTIGEDVAVEAMRAGARDYVLKDKLTRLTAAVERELKESAERAAHRAADHALRDSESRFHRLAQSGVVGITTSDVHGKIVDANDAYLRMIGYSREELRQGLLDWSTLTPPEYLHLGARAVEQLQANGVAPAWEMELFRKDGTRIPLLIGVASLEFPHAIAFVADLTAQRHAETARATAEETLRRTEDQLRQAQKMEAIGRLAGGIAHDFNNVLSVILSYAELILAELRPADPLRGDIEEIATAATRAAALTRQLLLFSRQELVAPKVLDLNEILKSMEKMLQRILGEDVDMALATNAVGRVKADAGHIEQVILNLVVNARDAMPVGGKLTIETADVTVDDDDAAAQLSMPPGRYLMLAVTDTGTGMDKATQARIFEPFFTTKERGKGTGLGLSTVFGIVQQSGGQVWVYSELERGTTLKVYLPYVDAEPDRVESDVAARTLRGTETILLVEDEDQVRTIVASILKRQGYHLIVAENGGEALLACEQHPEEIDLLLTDVVMPQMSGPALARRLGESRPKMRALFMSGYTDDSIIRHGVLESGVAFVQKPVTPTSLARKVREVLDRAD